MHYTFTRNPVPIPRRQALAHIVSPALALAALALPARAGAAGRALAADSAAWLAIQSQAKGQTVYFNAWAGSPAINAYIQWAAAQLDQRYGLRLVHVKISDAAEMVQRVRNEKAATKSDGTVDLVWINGENFLAMKREGLLKGPFAEQLPSYAWVDTQGKPTTRIDFSEPVDGMEAPWGMAQLTLMVDSARVPQAPRNLAAWLAFAQAHPGRLTYPRPPDFHGTSWLKQMLLDLHPGVQRQALYQPSTSAAFEARTAALWRTLDTVHPHLRRKGRQFPLSAGAQRQMMADGELLWALTFNPNEAATEIAAGRLSASTISYQFDGGTLGNTHFLAIAFNTQAFAAAQVAANFLLSAQAQARKADIAVWGDPTVLAVDKLPTAQRAWFQSATLPGQLQTFAPAIPEPHASWVDALEKEWARRYGG
jgi:putative thiamine transport system substrate-binding protein